MRKKGNGKKIFLFLQPVIKTVEYFKTFTPSCKAVTLNISVLLLRRQASKL